MAMEEHRAAWTPPARPEWVRRLNEEGQCLDLKAVVPLDENSLIAAAKQNTGLADFGVDNWHEPFQVLIKSLDNDANLNLAGRLLTRTDLLMFLEARLKIEETYKRHPEINDEKIEKPFLIIGQGRSGTSYLLNLLALDPDNGAATSWEGMMPCPPPEKATYLTDPRIEVCDKRMTMWSRVTPELEAVHEFTARVPTEHIHLKALSFQCPAWLNILGQIPGYNAYMATKSNIPALEYEKRVMKLLQWKNPRKRWVIKDPDSIRYLPEVLQVFPDANCIWPHRDPARARASAINMIGVLGWIRSDNVFISGANEQIIEGPQIAALLTNPIDWIESGVLPKRQLCNIYYTELVDHPIKTMQKVYDSFGVEFTAAARKAMTDYIAAFPRTARPLHAYDKNKPDPSRDIFRKYRDYFDVDSHPG